MFQSHHYGNSYKRKKYLGDREFTSVLPYIWTHNFLYVHKLRWVAVSVQDTCDNLFVYSGIAQLIE